MLSMIIGKKLTDIYTVGFLYPDEKPTEFTQDLRWIYLEFEDILLELESIEQFSRLKITEVNEVRYLFEDDEDMIKVRSSVKDLVLVSSLLDGYTVKKLELKDGTEKNCAAVKIVWENGQGLFADPGFPYGIGIGGKEQETYWKDAFVITSE